MRSARAGRVVPLAPVVPLLLMGSDAVPEPKVLLPVLPLPLVPEPEVLLPLLPVP